jgi:site-specific DNA recombinase
MRIAVYIRVSTQRQAQMQTIEQQLESLQSHFQLHGWDWREDCVFRDDGYSGASLKRPGLDRLRDHVAQAHAGSRADDGSRSTGAARMFTKCF